MRVGPQPCGLLVSGTVGPGDQTLKMSAGAHSEGDGNHKSAQRGPGGHARLPTRDRGPGYRRGRTRGVSGSVRWLSTGDRDSLISGAIYG
jgi:hypothetical protein